MIFQKSKIVLLIYLPCFVAYALGLAGASIGKEVIWHYYEIKNYLNGYPMRVNMTGEAPNWILIGVCCVVSVICFIILHRRKAWRAIPKDSVPKRYRFELPAVLFWE